MASELRAIPEVLAHLGNELGSHGQSLAQLQKSCHRDADRAHAEWVGSSAGALSELLDGWASTSAAHLARFGDHADGLKAAAVAFLEMDRLNAGQLR